MILLHLIFLYLLQIIVFSVLVVSSELELPFGVFPVTDEYITRHSVRNIPAKTRGNRGFLPCKKVRGGVAIYDSQVERDFYLLLAHSPLVKWFQHQPHKIVFKNSAGNTKKYTPDVKIEFVNGLRFLVEIKDEITEEMKLENEDKWNAADKWARNRSMNFAIFTAEDIRTARLFNVWFTLGSSKVRENDKYMQKLRTLLSIHGMKGRKYNDLCREVEKAFNVPIAKAAQVICYAIYHGLVVLEDFSTKILTRNSIIRNKHGEERPFLSLIDEMDWNTFDVSEKTRESDFYSFEEESGFEESTFFGKKIPNVLKVGRIPDKCRDEVYKKYFIVDDFLDQPSDLRTTQWREDFINAKKESFDIEFSETSLYRWISGYKNKGLEGLRPDYGKRGKKKEFDTRTFDLMEKAKEYYLKPRVTLSEAHEQLKKLCKKAKPLISRVPSESALKKYIGQRTTYVERFYRRKGKKAYKALFNPSFASFQGAIMPMQVLQLDNTGFDIFPVDTEYKLPIDTPHLTAAIDCYTGKITGVYLSLEYPSSQTVLETLVQSIKSKEKYESIYNPYNNWPINGLPVLILVDNGMDYTAKGVTRFCKDYDIIVEYAPIKKPEFKAIIESWFNTLKKSGLKKEIKDGYRPDLMERLMNPDYKPQLQAVHTMQVLEEWLYLWIIDKYHLTNSYDDHIAAPYIRWTDAYEGNTMLILPYPREPPTDPQLLDDMLLNTLNEFPRTLDHRGVVWNHLWYNNDNLMEILGKHGKKRGKRITMDIAVRLDRRDVRQIWVHDPDTGRPIDIGLGAGWASTLAQIYGNLPINMSAWIRDVRSIPKEIRKKLTPYEFLKFMGREKRERLLNTSKKETKLHRKENEKIRRTKTIAGQLQQYNPSTVEITKTEQENNEKEEDAFLDEIFEELQNTQHSFVLSGKGAKRNRKFIVDD